MEEFCCFVKRFVFVEWWRSGYQLEEDRIEVEIISPNMTRINES